MDDTANYQIDGAAQYYKLLFDNNPSIVFSLDQNGFFKEVNKAALKFLGYSIAELRKTKFRELCLPPYKDEFEELFSRALTGTVLEFQTEIIGATGEKSLLEIACISIKVENNIIGVCCTARDNTIEFKKKAGNELISKISEVFAEKRNLEECLQRLLHEITQVNPQISIAEAWTNNFEEDFLFLATRYYSYKAVGNDAITTFESGEGLIGKVHQSKEKYFISDLQHSRDFIRQSFAKTNGLKSAMALPVIYNFRIIAVLAFYSCDQVQEANQLFEASEDLILQLAVEIERKKTETELIQFFNISPDLMCIAGMDGKFKKINEAFGRVLGYDKMELVNKPFIDLVYPDDRKATLEELHRLTLGIPTSYFENRYYSKDRSIKYLAWTVTPDKEKRIMYSVAKDITERKKIENALQSEKQRFLRMFQEAPVSMAIVKGKDYIFVNANELYYRLTGRTPQIIGKSVVEVFPELKNHGYLDWLNKVYHDGETFAASETLFYFDYDGSGNLQERYLNFVYQPYRNEEGQIDGIFYTGVDVTEQVLARRKIEESENRFRVIFQQASVGVAIKDPNSGHIIDANDKFLKIFGFTANEKNKILYDKMTHPTDWPVEKEKIDCLMNGEITEYNLEKRQYRKDGSLVWVNISVSAMWKMGEKPSFLIAIVQDITERVKAQMDLKKSESRLAHSQEVAKIGSWETDLSTFEVLWSAETYRIFELDSNNKDITHDDFIRMVHPEDRELVDGTFKDSFTSKAFHTLIHRIVTLQGSLKYLEQRWSIFHDEHGQPTMAFGTCQDITEQKITQEAKEIAEKKARISEQLLFRNQKKALNELKIKEEEIRNFAKHLNTMLEEERTRIAREIHDEFGQQLTGLRMSLSSTLKLTKEAAAKSLITQMLTGVDTSINSLRNFANELRPIMLDKLGLIPSIEWLVQEFERNTSIEFDLFINVKHTSFSTEISTTFFRICQEALTNIMKHANAKVVRIRLIEKEDQLILEVKDNGRGINSLSSHSQSMGIRGMRERAALISANLVIESKGGRGTSISLAVKT